MAGYKLKVGDYRNLLLFKFNKISIPFSLLKDNFNGL